MKKENRIPVLFSAPLLSVLAVHMMCESMVIPILVGVLVNPISPELDMIEGASKGMRNFFYGLSLGVYPVAVFFFAPVIGALSDAAGRRMVLIVSIALSAAVCAMQGAGVLLLSLPVFVLSRVLLGAVAGVDGTIQASLVSRCRGEAQKNFYLGATLFAMSFGIMTGPAFASVFITDGASLAQWSAPFFLCALFFAACTALMFVILPKREYSAAFPKKVNLLRPLFDIGALLKNSSARALLVAFVCVQVSSGCFSAALPLILNEAYAFSPRMLAAFISFAGLAGGLTFAPVGPWLLKRFSAEAVLNLSVSMAAVVVLIPFFSLGHFVWLIILPMAFAFPLNYYVMVAIFSRAASEDRRGWLLSALSGIWGLTFGLGMAACGGLGILGNYAPLVFCSALGLPALFLVLRGRGIDNISV